MTDLRDAVDAAVRRRRAIAVDLLVVIGLVGGLWCLFDVRNFDNWLYYVVLFGAVVVYATLVPFGALGADDAVSPDDAGDTTRPNDADE